MSDSNPIDLSELQSLGFRPDWAGSKPAEAASAGSGSGSGEVVWNYEQKRGGGGGGGRNDRGDRSGPRGGGGGFGGPRRNDGPGRGFENRGPGGPGGDRRGPGPGGPRPERRDGPPRPAGDRGPRPGGPGAGQGPGSGDNRGPRPERRDGPGFGPPRQGGGGDRGPRREGGGGGDRFQGGGRGPRRDDRFFEERPRLPDGWFVRLLPEPRAVEALSKQIKASGRAYSVFDVAKLFLGARDRYLLHFYYKPLPPQRREGPPGNEAAPPPPPPREEGPTELLQCLLDGSVWLTRDEALRHVRESGLMNELYREETVEVDPPKGNFSAIAVCGFSGVLLGPPNHHSYPVAVARLHREKFANMSLDRFKARIHIDKGEEIVKKWLDEQSKETQFVALKVAEGEEAPRFKSLAERDADFMKNHAEEVLKSVREVTVSGNIPGKLLSPGLLTILRMELDRQNRFPMHLVQELCRELENHGLRFFKRDKKSTFVCRSRPQFIGNNVPLSDRVRSIIEMVRANPGIGYTKLVSTLAPSAPEPKVKAEPAAPVAEGEETPVVAGETEAPTAEATAAHLTLSTDEIAVMQDLKWLVQEGFITEFSNGELQILGRERPQDEGGKEPREGKENRPAKGDKRKGDKQQPKPQGEGAAAVEGAVEAEAEASEVSEEPADKLEEAEAVVGQETVTIDEEPSAEMVAEPQSEVVETPEAVAEVAEPEAEAEIEPTATEEVAPVAEEAASEPVAVEAVSEDKQPS